MRRLAALVAAIAMVAAALWVRGRIDDGGNGSPRRSGALRLLCITELEDACRAAARELGAAVDIAPAGATLRQLSAADAAPEPDSVWVTFAPLPAMVGEARQRATLPALLGSPTDPVARSHLGIYMWEERLAVLRSCRPKGTGAPKAPTWKCIGDAAGRPWTTVGGEVTWGQVKIIVPSPGGTATGTLLLGQLAADYFGRADLSATDFADARFRRWLAAVADSSVVAPSDDDLIVGRALTTGPALLDAFGAVEAVARAAFTPGTRADDLAATRSAGTADVVAVPLAPGDADLDDVTAALREALGERWDTAPANDDNALPSAGALEALRRLWDEVTR